MAPLPSQLFPSAPPTVLLVGCGDRLPLRQQLTQAIPAHRLIESDSLAQALVLWYRGTVTWTLIDLAWASSLDFLTALAHQHPQRPLPASASTARSKTC